MALQSTLLTFAFCPISTHQRPKNRRRNRRGAATLLLGLVVSLFLPAVVSAQTTINVGTAVQFDNAMNTIYSNPANSYTINLTNNITMDQQVPIIASNANTNITFVGNNYTINGNGAFRPFFIESGNVTLQNLMITNASAWGGAGGNGGGGGGLGAGAAVFVDTTGHLTINNVNFTTNNVIGGAGGGRNTGGVAFGGGGGLGGIGGDGTIQSGSGQVFGFTIVNSYESFGGGGGGLYGNGGTAAATSNGGSYLAGTVTVPLGGGGGGGGMLGAGGHGGWITATPVGGGGGGTFLLGNNGTAGGDGGSQNGGDGGNVTGGNGNPGGIGGGGGGGAGGTEVGGGGGNGGQFGGGGGSSAATGSAGNGGFGGGGGGAGASGADYVGMGQSKAGAGGFGGGGGGGGGNGGFGGGGGGNRFYRPGGTSAFGGGQGSTGEDSPGAGGGGAGFGGAVFVNAGGTITVIDSTSFSGNTATGGAGGGGATGVPNHGMGMSDGNDIFLMRGVSTEFNISGGQTLTFAPPIGNEDGTSNPGVIIDKTGLGTLVLTGSSLFSGATTVDAGTLVVAGTLVGTTLVPSTLAGTMTVNSGGTLGGWGIVDGNTTINSGGTIHPHDVGAPLTINGNFTQSSGSTYSADISSKLSDQIIVNGQATIQGGASFQTVVDPAGTYLLGTRYVLLAASGGVNGTYTTANLPAPGQYNYSVFSLQKDPNDIQLVISSTDFSRFARTFNQIQTAGAIDRSSSTATGDWLTVINQLQLLNVDSMRHGLDQMTGDIYPSTSAIELQTTTTWMQLVSNRLVGQMRLGPLGSSSVGATVNRRDAGVRLVSSEQINDTMEEIPRYTPNWNGWTQGYGMSGNMVGNGNAGGLSYGVGGTVIGLDGAADDNTLVGGFGGYVGSTIGNHLVSSQSRINGFQLGLYELHCRDMFYLLNVDAFASNTYDATRHIDFESINRTAQGSSSGNQYAHYSEAGYSLGDGTRLWQPFAGVQYIYLDQNGYHETGAGSLNLTTGNQYVNSARTSLGARVSQEFGWLGIGVIPTAQARWQHEFGDGTQVINSSFAGAPTVNFATAGNNMGRDFGLFTLSTMAILSDQSSFFGSLDTQVSQNYMAVMGSAGFQYRW